ncbi:MAG: hypothetical protein Q4G69_09685 [Planctomycetia bacterium]|nr:hypothetical protein [Planctomycetia bacterium]
MKSEKNRVNRRSFLKTGGLAVGGMCGLSDAFTFCSDPRLEAKEMADAEAGILKTPKFLRAKPVWAAGREKEMNVSLLFSVSIEIKNGQKIGACILRMTGATIAMIKINGELAGYGPARGPHGWFRIDEWPIERFLKTGKNEITIEVAGYNCNSYYHLDQPSFLQAEIVDSAGNVLAATDVPAKSDSTAIFTASDLTGVRLQKVQRFSFQRPFIEVYDKTVSEKKVSSLARQPEVKYLPRRVPYPELTLIEPVAWLKTGTIAPRKMPVPPWRNRSLVSVGPKLKGYPMKDLDLVLSDKIQQLETRFDEKASSKKTGSVYQAGDVQIVDLGADYAGFFDLKAESLEQGTELVITFDEILDENGDVNFLRFGTCSAIQWTMPKTKIFSALAFEPHVGRYLKIHCLKGSFKLLHCGMREYAYPKTKNASFSASDSRLEKLFNAAVLTFRMNTLDVFMDCPHRERAGWLCDSFFTARSAFDLTGNTKAEQAFFENYRLPDHFEFLPDGMLPMCYPADHNDGVFIPNWSLWFIAELDEYARRSSDRAGIEGLRTKIEKLMKFFEQYENSDGLLEKLPSWIFVEWSEANKFVRDVNYPSNMLYAFALDAAGRIYGKKNWREKAVNLRKKIIEQAWDGTFFIDNAKRSKDGKLQITNNRSEVCQYFAFFFKTATPVSHPELWKRLLNEFGPDRIKKGIWPEIHKANAFVGNVLRLELLSQADRSEQLLKESVAYNEYMADRTGTLWENDDTHASCNHGFASHLCHVLYRDVLGIADVDPIAGKLKIRFQKFGHLDWAEGTRPVPGGIVRIRWEKKNGKLIYSLTAPDRYQTEIENTSGLEIDPY